MNDGDLLFIRDGEQAWGIPPSVAPALHAARFSQVLDNHTETGTDAPLGANLNLSEIPADEQLGVLQQRINTLEAYCNNLTGLCNTLIDVLQAAGLAD